MTLKGHASQRYAAPVRVSSYTGFQIVDVLFTSAELASGGSYAVWVSGRVGDVVVPTGANVQRQAIDVALATVNESTGQIETVSFLENAAWGLADGALRRGVIGPPTIGFSFLMFVGGGFTHPNLGSSWPADRSLALVARLRDGGSQRVGSVAVGDWHAVAWDLDAIGAGGYLANRFVPGAPVSFGDRSGGRTSLWLAPSAFPSDGSEWLTFWAARFWNYPSTTGTPWIEPYVTPNATFGSRETIDRVGVAARAPREQAFAGRSVDSLGGVRVVTPANLVTRFGIGALSGWDTSAADPAQPALVDAAVFAVHRSELYQFQYVQQGEHDAGDPLIGTANLGDPTGVVPAEIAAPLPAKWATLHQVRVLPSQQPVPAWRQYRPILMGSNQSPTYVYPWADVQTVRSDERLPSQVGTDLERFGNVGIDSRFELAHWSGVQGVPYLTDPYRPVEFASAVLFGLDDNPSNYELPPVLAGSVVAVIPGRESLDAASLDPLPRQPDADIREEVDGVEDGFVSDVGYRWPTPRFVGTRRSWTLTFSGLTFAERDALLAFLRARGAIQWTPPGESQAVACGILKRPTATQTDVRSFSIALELVELVYTGA